MWLGIVFTAVLAVCVLGQTAGQLPQVNIAQGSVVGTPVEADGNVHFEFYGIPYADSTAGTHRFKAPLPAPAFTDTFIADRKNIKCVRPLGVGYEGTEDCLVVDVITPTLDENSQLPVMVWIKGKEFDPVTEPELSFKKLIEKDVVIVSLNFRESILGYLCLGTETAPGNAGLKDIVTGLRWIRENIAQFGGNPESVTLFGHGTGAAAVDLVTLSPMSEGLVHKAIAQSGSSMAPWSVSRDPSHYAILVAEALGHTITDIESLSEVFRRTSVAALMAIINELELTDNSLAFAPCIENEELEGDEKFLIKSPYSKIIEGDYLHNIPFMLGFVENEGTIRAEEVVKDDWLEKMDESFIDFIQPDLEFETEEEEQSIADDIRAFYFEDRPINMENIGDYVSYQGHTMIMVSALRELQLRAKSASAPVFAYEFSYQGELGEAFVGPLIASFVGATHREELAYLFDTSLTTKSDSSDVTISDILIERWTNFAKTGYPTSDSSPTVWEPVSPENTNVLMIRNNENTETNPTFDVLIVNPYEDVKSFWEQIYSEHFLDAEGKWAPIDREEEEVDEIDVITEGPDVEGPENGGEDGEDGDGDGDEDEDEDDDEPGSASTAVGYTFLIISLFAVLDKFHSTQILGC